MHRMLLLDPRGQIAQVLLGHDAVMAEVGYTHLFTDHQGAIDRANQTGRLNDYTQDVISDAIERVAEHYGPTLLNQPFDIVVLTETDSQQGDGAVISEWNEWLDAARPMMDVADTVVLCVTDSRFDGDQLRAPDKVLLCSDVNGIIHYLTSVPAA